MSVNQSEVVRHYEQNEADALALIGAWRTTEDGVQQLLQDARVARVTAFEELAAVYLPGLDPAHIRRCEQLTGFRGFSRRDPIKAMGHEREVLTKTIARIEKDPRFVRRKLLVGPGGELTLALEEAQSMLEPWESDCARFESLPGWDELLLSRYDTAAYDVSFFEKRYWTLWKRGDEVCEALGMGDFGDEVLPAFQAADKGRQEWRAQVRDAQDKVDEVHELVRTRDQAEGRIPRLPEIYLALCREGLAQYLSDADLSLLEQWLKEDSEDPDRGVLAALRKAAGSAAKVALLEEILHSAVQRSIGELRTRKDKFQRKATKYTRAKYRGIWLPESVLDEGFQRKMDKYRARPGKFLRLAQKIAAYSAWERYDLAANGEELWFLEMTGKRPPSQLPSTRRWYDRHPDRELVLDEDEPDVATLAAVMATSDGPDTLGYLS